MILLGENCCWSLLGLKGISKLSYSGPFLLKIKTIHHFCIEHNAPCLPPPPPPPSKKKFITIVFDLSWDDCNIQEKLETLGLKIGGGGGKEGMWVGEEPRCIMVFVKIVNGKSQWDEVQHFIWRYSGIPVIIGRLKQSG